jgi:two-component system sensor histidine kinase YesM
MGLNRKGEKELLEHSILALRQMLHYVQDSNPWASLGQEIAFLESYCSLQKLRFPHRFSYTLSMDEGCQYLRIPKLLLQPLVENAIIHGIEPMEKTGVLVLRCTSVRKMGENHGYIELSDNGTGFDTSSLEEKSQIGLLNVRQRLDAAFPNHHFTIESVIGKGTVISFFI